MEMTPRRSATWHLDNLLDGVEASVIEAADQEILGDSVEAPALRAAAIRHMMLERIGMAAADPTPPAPAPWAPPAPASRGTRR
jgi:hypothetical protein